MKTIKVVAAVIRDGEKVFATARGYGEFKGQWEFPGGKIEEGESPQQALRREIKEELDADIEVGELIETVEYDYPTFPSIIIGVSLSTSIHLSRAQATHQFPISLINLRRTKRISSSV